MRTFTLALLVAFFSAVPAVSAARAEVPWGTLPGVDAGKVDAGIQARAVEIMKAENCYHECPDTVHACVTGAAPTKTALRMAGIIVRLLLDGKTADEISAELKNRARSAHPFKTATVEVEGMPRLGPADAKVTVVIFADFDCPYCRVVSPRLKEIRDALGDDVALVFKLFPVKAHGAQAVETSKAGWAAHLGGCFWGLHDEMYEHFEDHGAADIEGMAARAGCDGAAFRAAQRAGSTTEAVRELKREGVKLGVKSTPTIFLNGKQYHGIKTETELRDRIEEELDLTRN
ncbi:MAG: DsbA family protein [Pseudomonadota bacterium]